MVDLSELKVGDTVKFRNGKINLVEGIRPSENNMYGYEVETVSMVSLYTKDGFFYCTGIDHHLDIVEIQKVKQKAEEKVIRNHVDLHNIAEGDVVYFEDGSEAVVDDVIFDEHFVDLYFYDFGRFEFNYDGTITCEYKPIIYDRTPEQMYQIMLALEN